MPWAWKSPTNWSLATVDAFWIGIGHAGTLDSGHPLCVSGGPPSSGREGDDDFAVVCAGIFPAFHVGRAWYAWSSSIRTNFIHRQNFRSPPEWDVGGFDLRHGVNLFGTWNDLDLALPGRDSASARLRPDWPGQNLRLVAGWRGSSRGWSNYDGLSISPEIATRLVLGVYNDRPRLRGLPDPVGWHTTIFPPYWPAARSTRVSAWC